MLLCGETLFLVWIGVTVHYPIPAADLLPFQLAVQVPV